MDFLAELKGSPEQVLPGYELDSSLEVFISQISFRFIQPGTRLPGYGELRKILAWLDVYPDVLNTRLPPESEAARPSLLELCRIPRMSTIAIAAIINRIVSQMPSGQVFLNVGVWNGFSFLAGLANNPDKRCIGVDNFCSSGGPRDAFRDRFKGARSGSHRFYEMDYLDYFATIHRESIGFYIFDGPHSYEHQLKNLEVAEPFFAPGCCVLVDDTNQDGAMRGTRDFLRQRQEQYEILLDQTTSRNCHPTWWNGVILFRKRDD
jgi:hypothetical protein